MSQFEYIIGASFNKRLDVLMEGLDIRTLAFTNLLLGLFLGIGSLVFARMHSLFIGFRALGYSYFLFSLGFILLGLRQYIPNFFSIIVANLAIITGLSLLILGILKFLKYERRVFKEVSRITLLVMFLSFVYFTYVDVNVNARIIIISTIMSVLSFYAGFKVLTNKDSVILIYTRLLGFAFLFGGGLFLLRVYFTFYELPLHNFMNAGAIHAFSLIALLLISITSFFSLTLSASQQLTNKLAIQATIDPLTAIYNRRAFDELAHNEIARAQRENIPLSIVLIDVDYFKQINDRHGHQVGDKLLKEFSAELKESLRQYDILARYGGEEFILLLPNTDADTATLIADKLRLRVQYSEFIIDNVNKIKVTASFGVATSKGEHINWQQLISFADQALYHAKNNGRNSVELHRASVHSFSFTQKYE